jgi:hypothetical protein
MERRKELMPALVAFEVAKFKSLKPLKQLPTKIKGTFSGAFFILSTPLF